MLPSDEIRINDEGRNEIAFERCQSLKEALAQLPHDQREVLVLRYIAGLPPREIADLLNKTDARYMVSTTAADARSRLRLRSWVRRL